MNAEKLAPLLPVSSAVAIVGNCFAISAREQHRDTRLSPQTLGELPLLTTAIQVLDSASQPSRLAAPTGVDEPVASAVVVPIRPPVAVLVFDPVVSLRPVPVAETVL